MQVLYMGQIPILKLSRGRDMKTGRMRMNSKLLLLKICSVSSCKIKESMKSMIVEPISVLSMDLCLAEQCDHIPKLVLFQRLI